MLCLTLKNYINLWKSTTIGSIGYFLEMMSIHIVCLVTALHEAHSAGPFYYSTNSEICQNRTFIDIILFFVELLSFQQERWDYVVCSNYDGP